MALEIVQLLDMIKSGRSEEEIKQILLTFRSIRVNEEVHDVEYFLHNKAIEFEKHDIARTYLVFSRYQERPVLVGYYSLSNKPLVISKKYFSKFSGALKKKLIGLGYKTESDNYEVKGYLLGQLGKNYSPNALATKAATGADLLALATETMHKIHKLAGGRSFYLECDDVDNLKQFYHSQGFREIENFKSENGYCIFVRRITD